MRPMREWGERVERSRPTGAECACLGTPHASPGLRRETPLAGLARGRLDTIAQISKEIARDMGSSQGGAGQPMLAPMQNRPILASLAGALLEKPVNQNALWLQAKRAALLMVSLAAEKR